jgi:DNA-binding NarL/FixJ family response regulator
MEKFLPNLANRDYTRIPTLVVAMPDMMYAEMVSEWQFNCNFKTLFVTDTGTEIINSIKRHNPEYLFIDSELPQMNGFDLAEKFKSLNLNTKIIMYVSKKKPDYLPKFMDSTNRVIRGFIHKGCGIQELERCFIEVFAGRKYLSNSIGDYLNEIDSQIAKNKVPDNFMDFLAKREKEVWQHLTQGKTEREMADKMNIGISTIKTYKKRIKERLDLVGKGKLTYIALKNDNN